MSKKDIEEFVEAPGRDDKVKEVRKKIDELGITYLYLQFVSVTGKIMGKGIPADHWESVAKKGFQLVTVGSDQRFISSGAKESLSKFNKTKSKDGKAY